jgi:hypothetical protein
MERMLGRGGGCGACGGGTPVGLRPVSCCTRSISCPMTRSSSAPAHVVKSTGSAMPSSVGTVVSSKTTFITPCASVNLDVRRGFGPDVSQSYHNREVDLTAYRFVRCGISPPFSQAHGCRGQSRSHRTAWRVIHGLMTADHGGDSGLVLLRGSGCHLTQF